jgi:hypothetical protein
MKRLNSDLNFRNEVNHWIDSSSPVALHSERHRTHHYEYASPVLIHETGDLPWMNGVKATTMATMINTWRNPPVVYPPINPTAQRARTAYVLNSIAVIVFQ